MMLVVCYDANPEFTSKAGRGASKTTLGLTRVDELKSLGTTDLQYLR